LPVDGAGVVAVMMKLSKRTEMGLVIIVHISVPTVLLDSGQGVRNLVIARENQSLALQFSQERSELLLEQGAAGAGERLHGAGL